jgi:hypothetical protein
MRYIRLAALLAVAVTALPAFAADGDNEPTGQMVVLKANQIGQIFCMSRQGNDEAVIQGILTDGLAKAIADAQQKSDAYAKQNPGDEPPLGDGIPWQSSPDYATQCSTGFVTLSRTDAKVEIKYDFADDPKANYIDTLILKKMPIEGMDVGYWRIDDVVYPDNTDLKTALTTLLAGAD